MPLPHGCRPPNFPKVISRANNTNSGMRQPEDSTTDGRYQRLRNLLLIMHQPPAFRADLAAAFNSQSVALSALGWLEDALAASEEAVEIYRRLVQALPGAFLPGIHFHDLRHSGNQFSADAGANLRELMEHMGHDSTRAALIY